MVVAGGVGVFAAVKTGAFLSPSKKVLLAGAKTVSDMGSLGETLKDCVSLYSDEYTLKMDLSMNEGDISMEGRCSKEKKQIKEISIFPVRLRSIFWLTSAQTVCRWKFQRSVNACLPMITEMKRVDICWNGRPGYARCSGCDA